MYRHIKRMGYISNNLMKGEDVVYRASVHWAVYFRAIFLAIPGLACLLISISGVSGDEELFAIVGAVFMLLALVAFCRALVDRLCSEYAVTNKRVILKTGLLSRSVTELMLAKCEGISFDQPLLGKILGYGTLIITTGGISNLYHKIDEPRAFRNAISEQADRVQNGTVLQ